MDFIARLNTRTSLAISGEEGIYHKFEGNADVYRNAAFSGVINYLVDVGLRSGDENEKSIAYEVKQMLKEQEPQNKPLDIQVLDELGNPKPNIAESGSNYMALEDSVSSYIDRRTLDNAEFDYLDFVVELNSKVGLWK